MAEFADQITVGIIDDDRGIYELAKYALGGEGYNVVGSQTADGGEELARTAEPAPHAWLVDFNMPGCDNMAARLITALDDAGKPGAVLASTANGLGVSDILKSLPATDRPVDALPKPYRLDQLYKKMDALVQAAIAQAQADPNA